MSDYEVELNIAAVRSRIVQAIAGDEEATQVLDRVFPADWGDAPVTVIWMLGNAARFATNMTGMGAAFAQNWLDRLVWPDGEPKECDCDSRLLGERG